MSAPGESDDREWLRGLYERNHDLVFRYAASRIGREAAMDVVADTFIEADRCRASFDPSRGTEASWLLGIATNLIRRLHRRDRRHVPLGEAWSEIGHEDIGLTGLPDRLDAELEAGNIQRAVDELPEGERAAILLHVVEGMAIREVATCLGIGRSAAKVRIFRARRRLRESLSHLDLPQEES